MNERPEHLPDAAPLRPNEVEVRMLATGERVPGVRALAADMAMREDFDLDAIADLRLAVEEACATVLANAEPDSTMVCRLLVSTELLEINTSATLRPGLQPSVGSMSLRILRTLADTVDTWTSTSNGRRLFHVQLTKSQP
ncbi:MAG TPA: ATP-binding protein [Pseudonocardiaceae bacterium]|nr:ATP-binding protein [Pseudonocardiaceae bacterium]